MGSYSEDKYDVWEWICKVIDSCDSISHIHTCERLIRNYSIAYGDKQLTRLLRGDVEDRLLKLINKIVVKD
jgi:hypothetical protein